MILDQYKQYLDLNTNNAMGFADEAQSRYHSFKFILDYLKNIPNPEILELGTCRSFVDGAFEGCNSDDPKYWEPNNFSKWDWGAGCFSLVLGLAGFRFTTLDIISDHINRCKLMTNSLNIQCNHIVSNSIDFLNRTDKKYHLIYLDTGDMWPIEPTSNLQLDEVRVIKNRNLLFSNGLLLIDDVKNKTPREYGDVNNFLGKSKYSIPYLLDNNYRTIFEGYQYILQKQ